MFTCRVRPATLGSAKKEPTRQAMACLARSRNPLHWGSACPCRNPPPCGSKQHGRSQCPLKWHGRGARCGLDWLSHVRSADQGLAHSCLEAGGHNALSLNRARSAGCPCSGGLLHPRPAPLNSVPALPSNRDPKGAIPVLSLRIQTAPVLDWPCWAGVDVCRCTALPAISCSWLSIDSQTRESAIVSLQPAAAGVPEAPPGVNMNQQAGVHPAPPESSPAGLCS